MKEGVDGSSFLQNGSQPLSPGTVHLTTMLDIQTELLRRHKRTEAYTLEAELNTIQQDQCVNENRMLRSILDLEAEINDWKEQLAIYLRRTESDKSSRNPFFDKWVTVSEKTARRRIALWTLFRLVISLSPLMMNTRQSLVQSSTAQKH